MNVTNKKTRSKPATDAQKNFIVKYMKCNEELVHNKFSENFTYEKRNELWEVITMKMNRLGPERNTTGWQKYWNDLRSRTKKSEADRRKQMRGTGGGPPPADLSPTKKDILDIMGGETVINGVGVAEHGFGSTNNNSEHIETKSSQTSEEAENSDLDGDVCDIDEIITLGIDAVTNSDTILSEDKDVNKENDQVKSAVRKRKKQQKNIADDDKEIQQLLQMQGQQTNAMLQMANAFKSIAEVLKTKFP